MALIRQTGKVNNAVSQSNLITVAFLEAIGISNVNVNDTTQSLATKIANKLNAIGSGVSAENILEVLASNQDVEGTVVNHLLALNINKLVVSNMTTLTNAQCESLKCGDIVLKEDSTGKHSYIVTYKKNDTGMCITYVDASVVETVSYDLVGGSWVYNSTDVTEIAGGGGTAGAVNYKGTFNSPIVTTPEKGDYYVCSADELYLNGNMGDIHESYAFVGKDYIVVDTGAKTISQMNDFLASLQYVDDSIDLIHLHRDSGSVTNDLSIVGASVMDLGEGNIYALAVSKVTEITAESVEAVSICMYFSDGFDAGEGMTIPEAGWYNVNEETGTFTKIENNKIIVAIQKPSSAYDSQFTVTNNLGVLDATVISASNTYPILFKNGDWTVYNGSSWNLVIGHSIDNIIGDINTILDSINGEVI